MPGKSHRSLSPLESVVMDAVWALEQASVRQAQEQVRKARPLAYNTILTVMRILRDKGFLTSTREGRLDLYRPLVSREQVARRSLREVLDRFFAGSPGALVSHMLGSERLSREEILAIRREVNQELRGKPRRKGEES